MQSKHRAEEDLKMFEEEGMIIGAHECGIRG